MTHYIIYTDGSALGNPGPGGSSAVFIQNNKVIFSLYTRSKEITTNNKMELGALILTFYVIKKCFDKQDTFEIYSDSQYSLKGLQEWIIGWRKRNWKNAKGKPVANKELWQQADKLYSVNKQRIKLYKVAAHAGIYYNELADKLAKRGAMESRRLLNNKK